MPSLKGNLFLLLAQINVSSTAISSLLSQKGMGILFHSGEECSENEEDPPTLWKDAKSHM